MAFEKSENRIIKIQVDDSEVKKFYREFNNTSITYKIFLEEGSKNNFKREISHTVYSGMKEGSRRGSKALSEEVGKSSQKINNSIYQAIEGGSKRGAKSFNQNFKKEFANLDKTFDGTAKKMT